MTAWTQSTIKRFVKNLQKHTVESSDKATLLVPGLNLPSMQVMHWKKIEPRLTMSFKTYIAETLNSGYDDKRKIDYILVGETARGCWAIFQEHYAPTRQSALADITDDIDPDRRTEIEEFVAFLDLIANTVRTRLETHFSCNLGSTVH